MLHDPPFLRERDLLGNIFCRECVPVQGNRFSVCVCSQSAFLKYNMSRSCRNKAARRLLYLWRFDINSKKREAAITTCEESLRALFRL